MVQHTMEGSTSCWSIIRPHPEHNSSLLSSSSSSSSSSPSVHPQYLHPSSMLPLMTVCHDTQDLPESWSQLLMGGYVGDEEKYISAHLQTKMIANWETQLLCPSTAAHMADMKQEHFGGHGVEDAQESKYTWNQLLQTFSPRSCVPTSFSRNMVDFSNKRSERAENQPENLSECNGTATGAVVKKARVLGSSSSTSQSVLKVRKEKLGDRITALHQLVSPFGKTDTASVLLEAIGYIRFLQSQIEALSSPYLSSGSGNMKQPLSNEGGVKRRGGGQPDQEGSDEAQKDLRSRGLCLVPVSLILHADESDAGGDHYWGAPTLHGAF
ncbi:transcription factor bHLH68 isoform X1 [Musa acuminata AAA Group]|uniref:transcription factor bHLH68 isoform X1 n=1 Tax=Musa acuminata AAA Group TaxID=214697 RepID=UPI0031DB76B3